MERNVDDYSTYKDDFINFGGLGYSPALCACITGLDEGFIESQIDDDDTEIGVWYARGAAKADYIIDLKLFELAQQGDIRALDKLEQRKKTRQRNEKANKSRN